MKKLISKVSLTIILGLLLIALPAYFGFFKPLQDQLEEVTLANFTSSVLLQEGRMEAFIDRSVEGAKSISSRTMIRRRLADYLEGRLEGPELVDYTQPLYADGLEALESVSQAKRVARDGLQVASYKDGEVNFTKGEGSLKSPPSHLVRLRIQTQPRPRLIVHSPILEEKSWLGTDSLIYRMDDLLLEMNQNGISYQLIDQAEARDLFGDTLLVKEKEKVHRLVQTSVEDIYLMASIDEGLLYKDIQGILDRGLVRGLIFLALVLIVSNGLIIRYAGKLLRQKEKVKKKFETFANIDSLTRVHTRRAYDEYIKDLPLEGPASALVMVDVDKLKTINDNYGHPVGDKVLSFVADELVRLLRCEDRVFRYGGDEFLLLLSACSLDGAQQILERVREALKTDNPFNFSVDISYGLAKIDQEVSYGKALEAADAAMYQQKNKKKAKEDKD